MGKLSKEYTGTPSTLFCNSFIILKLLKIKFVKKKKTTEKQDIVEPMAGIPEKCTLRTKKGKLLLPLDSYLATSHFIYVMEKYSFAVYLLGICR